MIVARHMGNEVRIARYTAALTTESCASVFEFDDVRKRLSGRGIRHRSRQRAASVVVTGDVVH